MKKNKTVYYLFILVLVLIVLNVVTIGFFVFFGKSCDPRNREGKGTPGDYLIHELKFTPEQQSQFENLRSEHHNSVCPFMDEIKKQKTIYFSELKMDRIDTLKVDSMSKLITELHRKVDLTTFWHFNKIRHICTPQQQERFDEIIQEGLLNPQPKQGPMRHLTD